MSPTNDEPVELQTTPPSLRLEDLPAPVTAVDRLQTIYRSPAPYATAYLALGDTVAGRFDRRILVLVDELREQGASDAAIQAVEARLALPPPADVAGVAVLAADDGTTVVDYGLEPPFQDSVVVDSLPHVAPLLEWDQRRVSHQVITLDDAGADLALFGLDHFSHLERVDGDDTSIVERAAAAARMLRAELIVLTGHAARTAALADALVPAVGVHCRVVVEPPHEDLDELVDATVRQVNDTVARRTVGLLREHRFLDDHDAAVDGRPDTVAELVAGTAARLLVHDAWIDQERIWIGSEPTELTTTPRDGYRSARLIDALIWSAVLQGVPVHIIPSTGPDGPAEDTGAIVDEQPNYRM
jgi:hypothetical protein